MSKYIAAIDSKTITNEDIISKEEIHTKIITPDYIRQERGREFESNKSEPLPPLIHRMNKQTLAERQETGYVIKISDEEKEKLNAIFSLHKDPYLDYCLSHPPSTLASFESDTVEGNLFSSTVQSLGWENNPVLCNAAKIGGSKFCPICKQTVYAASKCIVDPEHRYHIDVFAEAKRLNK